MGLMRDTSGKAGRHDHNARVCEFDREVKNLSKQLDAVPVQSTDRVRADPPDDAEP